MKNYLFYMRLSMAFLVGIVLSTSTDSQTLLIENFNYSTGTSLTSNGWNAHSGSGSNPVTVGAPGLLFQGYPSSNIGLAAMLLNDGEDVNRTFTNITTGNVYCAFMMKANSVTGDYFLHLSNSGISSNRGRVFIKGTGTAFNLGLSKGAESASYTTGSQFNTGTTYLIVLKYSISEGASNDNVSLFAFSGPVPVTEPATPLVGPVTDVSQSDLSNVSAVALRQFSSTQNIIIDGIRIAQKWEDAVGTTTRHEDISGENDPVIFPVPARTDFWISNIHNVDKIEIFDMTGKNLITIKNESSDRVNIPVFNLTGGLYLIKLSTSDTFRIYKFIKF
jgi:hypothetical protein